MLEHCSLALDPVDGVNVQFAVCSPIDLRDATLDQRHALVRNSGIIVRARQVTGANTRVCGVSARVYHQGWLVDTRHGQETDLSTRYVHVVGWIKNLALDDGIFDGSSPHSNIFMHDNMLDVCACTHLQGEPIRVRSHCAGGRDSCHDGLVRENRAIQLRKRVVTVLVHKDLTGVDVVDLAIHVGLVGCITCARGIGKPRDGLASAIAGLQDRTERRHVGRARAAYQQGAPLGDPETTVEPIRGGGLEYHIGTAEHISGHCRDIRGEPRGQIGIDTCYGIQVARVDVIGQHIVQVV